jgi:hypothetical protein
MSSFGVSRATGTHGSVLKFCLCVGCIVCVWDAKQKDDAINLTTRCRRDAWE